MRDAGKLVVGTVQFGMAYGVANQGGQVSKEEASAILSQARQSGVSTLDTAIAYGQSEQVLGELGVQSWKVISKLPAIKEQQIPVKDWVFQSVQNSLNKLRIPKLHGLLLHHPDDLKSKNGDELYRALLHLKEQGKVGKIGVSIYDPSELSALCEKFDFDIVQAPYNILDRRIVSSGWAERLKKNQTEVHVRSAFLQGLLLMKERPAYFDRWQSLWQRWDLWLQETSVTALQACLNFAFGEPLIDQVIVGVDSLKQWNEILLAVGTDSPQPPRDLISEDLDLLTPSRWSKK